MSPLPLGATITKCRAGASYDSRSASSHASSASGSSSVFSRDSRRLPMTRVLASPASSPPYNFDDDLIAAGILKWDASRRVLDLHSLRHCCRYAACSERGRHKDRPKQYAACQCQHDTWHLQPHEQDPHGRCRRYTSRNWSNVAGKKGSSCYKKWHKRRS